MKVIIAGSRSFNDYPLLCKTCDEFLSHTSLIDIVSGAAIGADKLGEIYAAERGYSITRFIPEWEFYGKRAGYIRNAEMAKYADSLIIFWDGKSKGSKHMLDLAQKHGLNIKMKIF